MKLNPSRCPECNEKIQGTIEMIVGIANVVEQE